MIESITIKKCLKGDQSAFKKAYNDTLPYVLSIVRRYIYEEAYRPDIVQEVYIQLFNNLANYDSKKGEFKPYLRKITVNCCITTIRKKSRKPLIQSLTKVEEDTLSDQSEEKILSLSREEILQLLSTMPQGYKIIFLLYAIDGFSHKEIAEKLNISPETSRSQYSRARKWLMKNYTNSTIKQSYGIF